ncbi:acyl-CoA dehydrogenase family protein [Cognatilysobacter lacus]|uniref:Acyl-CoA dehydrogenase n=1 Tax=Cognatilysobacter lacus TaxID=1643323 RepID=A0A5D8ZFL6_9GAMM|nr:acyl-CoA dehydrogenase family protein [Lysobacter lacus]TZF91474.1 acyl-CoA dehydrogenase [Lysobacter lacus]
MNEYLSGPLVRLVEQAETVATTIAGPASEQVDRDAAWPEASMRALAAGGLTGLTVPAHLGGHGQGLLGMAALTEVLGRACASTAMCFGMHCVGTAVIAAKATSAQQDAYLRPIARGEHLTTLALSETGTGAHFFLPQTRMRPDGDGYVVDGGKQFVTNGGHVDSYVVSTTAEDAGGGEFSCVVVDADSEGVSWGAPWAGFGMRGNSSRPLTLDGVRVDGDRLLGAEGDQVWYVFEVVAPFFLTAMAGTYVGVAQAALDITLQHLRDRRHAHTGQALADVDLLQHRVGQLWMQVEKSRLLLFHAARLGDLGSPVALTAILASKADAATTAVNVVNEAMTLGGGIAYRENSTLSRLLRDARAGHVMSPTTDLLTLWAGRSALGLPLL